MKESVSRDLPPPILVVEDSDSLRSVICEVLEREGFAPTGVRSAEECLKLLPDISPACILSDFKLPGRNGIALLKEVRARNTEIPFLLTSAYGSIEIAVEAMKHGANDFISKPLQPGALAAMIRDVLAHDRIIHRQLATRLASRSDTQLLRGSPYLATVLGHAGQVAKVDTSVLILGESGTGKELLARFIHEHSSRRNDPFVAVNCAAIPSELLESELFGHEEGAFTGATKRRAGVLEVASAGTIFLDEVGDMPPLMQVKLLRALQEREIRPVGSTRALRINPRVIAATNRDIDEALAQGTLRDDFYFRLAVVTLKLPPLRERRDDIPTLAKSFILHNASRLDRTPPHLSPLAIEVLVSYPWPGNVRELENVMERAIILAGDSPVITPEHLGIQATLDFRAVEEASLSLAAIAAAAVRQAESGAIQRTLAMVGGNKAEAARTLGVSYKTLLSKIKEYGITTPEG